MLNGKIEDSFGKTGKFKAVFYEGLQADDKNSNIRLNFKKYIRDKTKLLIQ